MIAQKITHGYCALVVVAALALGLVPPPVHAQSTAAQIDAQQQRLQRERAQQQRQQLQTDPTIGTAPPAATQGALPKDEQPCFTLRELTLVGDAAADFQWALAAANDNDGQADPVAGRCIGALGINRIMARVQNAIIARGLVTTRVVAQGQDISSGQLALTLIPGRINAIHVDAQAAHTFNNHYAIASRAGDLLNSRDIDQSLENLKRVPTAEAKIDIQPSAKAEPGLSDLQIRYTQTKPWRINLSLDDSGSQSTGVYQGSLTFSADNWLGLHELFYLTLNHSLGGDSPGPGSTRGNTAHLSLPWGYNQLAFTASNSSYTQTVAGLTTDIVYSGTSRNADLTLSRIVYRDARAKTKLSLGAFARASSTSVDGLEIQVQRKAVGGWQLGLTHETSLSSGKFSAGVNYKRATGAFGSLRDPSEAFGETDSRFRLLSANASISHDFNALGQAWKASSAWRAQTYGSRLTASDLFSIGGRYSVRGFDGARALSAEAGWWLRNEIGFDLSGQAAHLYLALDGGSVHGPSAAQLLGRSLSGAALGLRGTVQKLSYDLSVGAPLAHPPGFGSRSPTYALSVNFEF